jgi:hypothetical protein
VFSRANPDARGGDDPRAWIFYCVIHAVLSDPHFNYQQKGKLLSLSGENVVGKEEWREGAMVVEESELAGAFGYVRSSVRVLGSLLGDVQARLRLLEVYEPWQLVAALQPLALNLPSKAAPRMCDVITPPSERPTYFWVDSWSGWVFEADEGPETDGSTPRRAGYVYGDGRRHYCWRDDGKSWTVKASGEPPKLSGGAFYCCSLTGRAYILSSFDTWQLQGIPAELLALWKLRAKEGAAPPADETAVRRIAGNAITHGTSVRIVDDVIVGRQVEWDKALARDPNLGEVRGLEPARYGESGAARPAVERRAVVAHYGSNPAAVPNRRAGLPLVAAWFLSVVTLGMLPVHTAAAATDRSGTLADYTKWAAVAAVEEKFGSAARSWAATKRDEWARYGHAPAPQGFDPHGLRYTAAGPAFPDGVTPPRPTASMKQLWCPSYARMIPKIADHLVLGGLSMKTAGNYQRGFDQWVAFTENINRDGGETFPVLLTGEDPSRDERHLLAFISYEGWLMGNKPSTVAGKLSGIRWHHLDNGLPHPTEGKHRIASALRSLKKLRGEGTGKHPVTPNQLRHIKSRLDLSRARHVVTWAAVTLGFFLMMRCSEYLAEGNTFDPVRALTTDKLTPHLNGVMLDQNDWAHADSLTALFQISKTDQNRIGCTRTVFATGDDLCPVEAYKALREVRGDSWRPKLPVMGDAEGWVLNRDSIAATLKASAMDLGMDGAEFATHSLRIGGATAMAATRLYSDDEIRRFGRWKSDCWRRYVYAARDAVCNLAAAMSRVHVVTESRPSARQSAPAAGPWR